MGTIHKANYAFFKTWSHEMAYVLGFWYADGSVDYSPQIRGHYIRAGSTDKEVVVYIKQVLKSEHKIYSWPRPGRKTFYMLQIGSYQMFQDLDQLGVVERKSNIITFPHMPQEFTNDFIRGYFDGDGCVSLEKSLTGSYKRMVSVFTSGSKDFLLQLQRVLLAEAGLGLTKIAVVRNKKQSTAYQLRYSTRDSLRLFFFLYPKKRNVFGLSRKYSLFETYLKAKNITQKNLQEVLVSKGPIVT